MNILAKKDLLKYVEDSSSISFSIDRFEEDFAVCENKLTEEIILISQNLIPKEAKSGDILIFKNNMLIVDIQETQTQQENIKNLVEQLFKRKS